MTNPILSMNQATIKHADLRQTLDTLTAAGYRSVGLWREPVEAEFEIPEGYQLITGFALGYADPEAPINAMQAPRPPIQLLQAR